MDNPEILATSNTQDTRTNKTQKHKTTQKTKKMRNTDPLGTDHNIYDFKKRARHIKD